MLRIAGAEMWGMSWWTSSLHVEPSSVGSVSSLGLIWVSEAFSLPRFSWGKLAQPASKLLCGVRTHTPQAIHMTLSLRCHSKNPVQ